MIGHVGAAGHVFKPLYLRKAVGRLSYYKPSHVCYTPADFIYPMRSEQSDRLAGWKLPRL